MARRLAVLVFVIVLFSAVPRAQAQFTWISDFSHSVATDFKRNNCWPQPFVCPDRAAVRAPFNTMVFNGWQIQNMISEYHFDEVTGELTQAGKNKIYWIFTQAPEQHRIVYVQKSREPGVTGRRMQIVQALASSYAPEGTLARVEMTTKESVGWTAETVGFVSQAFQTTAPPPRLPASSGGLPNGGGN